jgi:hypothetical protein
MYKFNKNEINKFQTNFLIKIKHTLLKRMDIKNSMTKTHSYMLIDVLRELDNRRINN